jgi:hypothetical protein
LKKINRRSRASPKTKDELISRQIYIVRIFFTVGLSASQFLI